MPNIGWYRMPGMYQHQREATMSTTDSNMEDLKCLSLIRQGGKMRDQGVAALWRKYADPKNKTSLIWKLIRKSNYKLSEEDADEIMQETFIRVGRSCESYRGDAPFEAWLWRIAFRCMIDHFNSVKSRSTTDADKKADKVTEGTKAVERAAAINASNSRVQDGVRVTELPYAQESEEEADRFSSHPKFISIDNDGNEGDGLAVLEGQFNALWKYDPPVDKVSFEDCIVLRFTEFASKSEKNSKRALAIRLAADGHDQESIAHVINHKPSGIRTYLYECRKIIQEFLLPCQEFQ